MADLSNRLLEGQVNVDYTADVTRNCTIQLLDPDRTLSFESDSADEGAIYMDRMIRVVYSVKVPQMNAWVDIPVFCGPVVSMDRSDSVISLEAQGKENLAKGAAWRTFTRKKNTNKGNVIKDILADLTGENKFDFPEVANKLSADYSLGRESIPWDAAKSLASGMSRQLFYDGRGYCKMRSLPGTPVFTFKSEDGGTVLSTPQISYDSTEMKNAVLVKGGVPKGAKTAVSVFVAADKMHPLSPARLGRNGVPRYLLEVIEDDSIRSNAEAEQKAGTVLNDRLLQTVDVKFDAMPIPHLEPGDLVRIQTDEYATTFRLYQFSIPLVVGDTPMSVGYNKRLSVRGNVWRWTPKKKK
ncbi:hypothetical protein [Streptomyces lasalocidi]|uniref:Uncharacterized protein n=1 Tax=Streptomyces lasalocidi TaxID=324833 RepID=A0A4U5WMW2_STRLS|nr:hypothetical protein [Streptomyces lasalocidi]TKT03449.1 hypothetical protein E4U91_27380 [Streptomyces lasalocidi]